MVHIHAESKNFNASGDDANDIQVDLLFWFFIIFLINLLTIIGTSSRGAWYRNEGKYDIVFAPKNKFYDIVMTYFYCDVRPKKCCYLSIFGCKIEMNKKYQKLGYQIVDSERLK